MKSGGHCRTLRIEYELLREMCPVNKIKIVFQYYGTRTVFAHISDFFKKSFKGRRSGSGHAAWKEITVQ